MLPLAQYTCHFHFLALMTSRTVLGQSSVPVCPYKLLEQPQTCVLCGNSIQYRQQNVLLQHAAVPTSQKPFPAPSSPLAPSDSQQCLNATMGSCHVTRGHPLGQAELDDHPPPQHAPDLHALSSGASATFTKPAIHLVDFSSSQAVITREVPTNYTVPWRPLDSVIQTVVL